MLRIEFGVHNQTHAMYDFEVTSKMATLVEELGYDYFFIGDHFFADEKVINCLTGIRESQRNSMYGQL